ncbi:hypothetical protein ACFLWL_04225 [Chloroflexota bacterium]
MKRLLVVILLLISLLALTLTSCGNSEGLTLTVREPEDGEAIKAFSINVRGDVSDSDAKIFVNNVEVSPHPKYRSFYLKVDLTEGENVITVVATLGEETVTKTVTVTRIPFDLPP